MIRRLGLIFLLSMMPALGFGAEEIPAEKLIIQAKIPRAGDFMGFGFDSLWMMSGSRLVRVNPANNSFIEIDVHGESLSSYRALGVGEGAVWIASANTDLVLKVDPNTRCLPHV